MLLSGRNLLKQTDEQYPPILFKETQERYLSVFNFETENIIKFQKCEALHFPLKRKQLSRLVRNGVIKREVISVDSGYSSLHAHLK